MDSELVTQLLLLLTSALTAWQEFRHRKDKKTVRPSEMLQAKPTKGAK